MIACVLFLELLLAFFSDLSINIMFLSRPLRNTHFPSILWQNSLLSKPNLRFFPQPCDDIVVFLRCFDAIYFFLQPLSGMYAFIGIVCRNLRLLRGSLTKFAFFLGEFDEILVLPAVFLRNICSLDEIRMLSVVF